jgi:hypothetical protein
MAVPKAAPGQFAALLFFVWTVAASVVLGRRARAVVHATPAAAGA